MAAHWANAIFLLTTLVMKANGVDDNGMDLSFTNGPVKLKDSNDHAKFEAKMRQNYGKPLNNGGNPTFTNILKPFEEMMNDYTQRVSVAVKFGKSVEELTVIVLTDGLWDAIHDDYQSVSKKIIAFQNRLKELQGGSLIDRQVTFEFIRFGNNPKALERLKYLDDRMKGHE